jgi:hypothetical protein
VNYTITYSRRGSRQHNLRLRLRPGATPPEVREEDAERYSALIEALTGVGGRKVYHMKDGRIIIECGREHLEGFARFAELASAIARWLEETGRR